VADAIKAGIAFVHQELNLFDNLDVAGNVYIGREPVYGGPLRLIDRKRLHAQMRPLLERLGADFEPDASLAELRATSGGPVALQIVRESEIAAGLRMLRAVGMPVLTGDGEDDASPALADATAARGVPLLGDIMIEMGLVTRSAFEAALRDYRPERHGRIGDYMVAEAIITSDALTAAVAEQRRRYLARAGIR